MMTMWGMPTRVWEGREGPRGVCKVGLYALCWNLSRGLQNMHDRESWSIRQNKCTPPPPHTTKTSTPFMHSCHPSSLPSHMCAVPIPPQSMSRNEMGVLMGVQPIMPMLHPTWLACTGQSHSLTSWKAGGALMPFHLSMSERLSCCIGASKGRGGGHIYTQGSNLWTWTNFGGEDL